MKRRSLACLFWLLLLSGSILAQSAQPTLSPAETRIRKELEPAVAAYNAHQYKDALLVFGRVLAMPELKELPEMRDVVLYSIACVHSLLGERSQAIKALQEATASNSISYVQLAVDEDLLNLYGMPEFETIVRNLRTREGIGPLAWDRSQKHTAFTLQFEPADTPEYVQLRNEFKIDDAMLGVKDDLQRLQSLARWTSAQWEHDSMQMASHTDPLTILREAKAGGKFICMNYAVVLSGAAHSYGIPARVLYILPRDIEKRPDSHAVVEVWSEQFKKWAIVDAQYGIVPTVDGRPISAVELQEALVHGRKVECGETIPQACGRWSAWILQYLYYFKISRDQRWYAHGNDDSQLVLMPKGALRPKLYNGEESGMFTNAVFTSDPDVFYARPMKGRQ